MPVAKPLQTAKKWEELGYLITRESEILQLGLKRARNLRTVVPKRMETIGELPKTPEREDCVKRLFGDGDVGSTAHLNSSEYFSQSSEENGGSQNISSPQVTQLSVQP